MSDLTWTGNNDIDPALMRALVVDAAASIDFTKKGEVWSETLQRKIGEHFAVPPTWVRVGCGSTQMIEVILRTLYRSRLVDLLPNFHLAGTVARQEGWTYFPVAIRQPEELLECTDSHLDDPAAVFVLSSPRNPLSYQVPLDILRHFLDRLLGWLLLDEVYADFAPVTALSMVADYPRLIVARTFSKAWGLANLRVGFAVSQAFASEKALPRLLPNSVTGLAQQVAARLLDAPAPIIESIARIRRQRDLLASELRGIPGLHVWHSDANYICIETAVAREIVQALHGFGIRTRWVNDLPGYPRNWPDALRLTIPRPADRPIILNAIAQCVNAATPTP